MSRNFLSNNGELHKGDSLVSNNGAFKAVFQEDGNFVAYGWKPVWASDTCGTKAFRLVMQSDCNLVIYDKGGKPLWDAKSNRPNPGICRLQLTDEGELVVSSDAERVWASSK
ncbi:mannose-specific lectin-like [Gymnodraco acuticeps]|uniref:Mannose-specific lectin-like n=1 Tax=Gymnodraco acuticeps TaxID=8218 RepID=A0A6P8SPM7_GYMAC|nr:mannose-specific lectin-like [Gymnodraco acuticeps]